MNPHQLLQLWGGLFYLLNKIFLFFSEKTKNCNESGTTRKWRIRSWVVYLAGLPAWVIILVGERNWIAASVELSGTPAMILGLVTSMRGTTKNPPRWLEGLALICIPIGLIFSFYDFGGITTVNQWLEISLVLGFLTGTYLLAKECANGYLWFVLMNVSCAALMWIQGYPWLTLQQLISLVFVLNAYKLTRKNK